MDRTIIDIVNDFLIAVGNPFKIPLKSLCSIIMLYVLIIGSVVLMKEISIKGPPSITLQLVIILRL